MGGNSIGENGAIVHCHKTSLPTSDSPYCAKHHCGQIPLKSCRNYSDLDTYPTRSIWDPSVCKLISNEQWLASYGLEASCLQKRELIRSIGFLVKEEYVPILGKYVKSSYAEGLFSQMNCGEGGKLYNITANRGYLKQIEIRLSNSVELFKGRIDWLCSGSRNLFGVIQEHSIVIILDIQTLSPERFHRFKQAVSCFLSDQVQQIAQFNLIKCQTEPMLFSPEIMVVTPNSINQAVSWLEDLDMLSPSEASSTANCISLLNHKAWKYEAAYLITDGESSLSSPELLKKAVDSMPSPLNIVAFDCSNAEGLHYLQSLCQKTGGRFHAYIPDMRIPVYSAKHWDAKDHQAELAVRFVECTTCPKAWQQRADCVRLFEELEEARDTLKQIQQVLCDIENVPDTIINSTTQPCDRSRQPAPIANSCDVHGKREEHMSSSEWLEHHGFRAQHLELFDVLAGFSFKHCDGVITLLRPPEANERPIMDSSHEDNAKWSIPGAIVHPKLVNARYCDKFVHVRWKDGSLVHVQVTPELYRSYARRVSARLTAIKKRIDWLSRGSRELFGTITEDEVYVLVDTSTSMMPSIDYLKSKLSLLLSEQLQYKNRINLIAFNSRINSWSKHLVPTTGPNLESAAAWIRSLTCGGSTNTSAALQLALADGLATGIYLLSDGRPDQDPRAILLSMQLNHPIPIHTVSFNCSDPEANQFLRQLAQETGGRFHCATQTPRHPASDEQWESEELRLLRAEYRFGMDNLEKMAQLRDECKRLAWRSSSHSALPSSVGRGRKRFGRNRKPASWISSTSQSDEHLSTTSVQTEPLGSAPSESLTAPTNLMERPSTSKKAPENPVGCETLLQVRNPQMIGSGRSRLSDQQAIKSRNRSGYRSETSYYSLLNSLCQKNDVGEDFVLLETKELLDRQARRYGNALQAELKAKQKEREAIKRAELENEEPVTIENWIARYGLKAQELRLFDLIAPVAVPLRSTYVPALKRHVTSEVLRQTLPLAVISATMPCQKPSVRLINPHAIDFARYERALCVALKRIERKLVEIIDQFLGQRHQQRLRQCVGLSGVARWRSQLCWYQHQDAILETFQHANWPFPSDELRYLTEELDLPDVTEPSVITIARNTEETLVIIDNHSEPFDPGIQHHYHWFLHFFGIILGAVLGVLTVDLYRQALAFHMIQVKRDQIITSQCNNNAHMDKDSVSVEDKLRSTPNARVATPIDSYPTSASTCANHRLDQPCTCIHCRYIGRSRTRTLSPQSIKSPDPSVIELYGVQSFTLSPEVSQRELLSDSIELGSLQPKSSPEAGEMWAWDSRFVAHQRTESPWLPSGMLSELYVKGHTCCRCGKYKIHGKSNQRPNSANQPQLPCCKTVLRKRHHRQYIFLRSSLPNIESGWSFEPSEKIPARNPDDDPCSGHCQTSHDLLDTRGDSYLEQRQVRSIDQSVSTTRPCLSSDPSGTPQRSGTNVQRTAAATTASPRSQHSQLLSDAEQATVSLETKAVQSLSPVHSGSRPKSHGKSDCPRDLILPVVSPPPGLSPEQMGQALKRQCHQRVIAFNDADGIFYPGIVQKCVSQSTSVIRFRHNGVLSEVLNQLTLPVIDMTQTQSLNDGDTVLVRVKNVNASCECWVPARVQGGFLGSPDPRYPLRHRYDLRLFSGAKHVFRRRDILKISPKFYKSLVKYIKIKRGGGAEGSPAAGEGEQTIRISRPKTKKIKPKPGKPASRYPRRVKKEPEVPVTPKEADKGDEGVVRKTPVPRVIERRVREKPVAVPEPKPARPVPSPKPVEITPRSPSRTLRVPPKQPEAKPAPAPARPVRPVEPRPAVPIREKPEPAPPPTKDKPKDKPNKPRPKKVKKPGESHKSEQVLRPSSQDMPSLLDTTVTDILQLPTEDSQPRVISPVDGDLADSIAIRSAQEEQEEEEKEEENVSFEVPSSDRMETSDLVPQPEVNTVVESVQPPEQVSERVMDVTELDSTAEKQSTSVPGMPQSQTVDDVHEELGTKLERVQQQIEAEQQENFSIRTLGAVPSDPGSTHAEANEKVERDFVAQPTVDAEPVAAEIQILPSDQPDSTQLSAIPQVPSGQPGDTLRRPVAAETTELDGTPDVDRLVVGTSSQRQVNQDPGRVKQLQDGQIDHTKPHDDTVVTKHTPPSSTVAASREVSARDLRHPAVSTTETKHPDLQDIKSDQAGERAKYRKQVHDETVVKPESSTSTSAKSVKDTASLHAREMTESGPTLDRPVETGQLQSESARADEAATVKHVGQQLLAEDSSRTPGPEPMSADEVYSVRDNRVAVKQESEDHLKPPPAKTVPSKDTASRQTVSKTGLVKQLQDADASGRTELPEAPSARTLKSLTESELTGRIEPSKQEAVVDGFEPRIADDGKLEKVVDNKDLTRQIYDEQSQKTTTTADTSAERLKSAMSDRAKEALEQPQQLLEQQPQQQHVKLAMGEAEQRKISDDGQLQKPVQDASVKDGSAPSLRSAQAASVSSVRAASRKELQVHTPVVEKQGLTMPDAAESIRIGNAEDLQRVKQIHDERIDHTAAFDEPSVKPMASASSVDVPPIDHIEEETFTGTRLDMPESSDYRQERLGPDASKGKLVEDQTFGPTDIPETKPTWSGETKPAPTLELVHSENREVSQPTTVSAPEDEDLVRTGTSEYRKEAEQQQQLYRETIDRPSPVHTQSIQHVETADSSAASELNEIGPRLKRVTASPTETLDGPLPEVYDQDIMSPVKLLEQESIEQTAIPIAPSVRSAESAPSTVPSVDEEPRKNLATTSAESYEPTAEAMVQPYDATQGWKQQIRDETSGHLPLPGVTTLWSTTSDAVAPECVADKTTVPEESVTKPASPPKSGQVSTDRTLAEQIHDEAIDHTVLPTSVSAQSVDTVPDAIVVIAGEIDQYAEQPLTGATPGVESPARQGLVSDGQRTKQIYYESEVRASISDSSVAHSIEEPRQLLAELAVEEEHGQKSPLGQKSSTDGTDERLHGDVQSVRSQLGDETLPKTTSPHDLSARLAVEPSECKVITAKSLSDGQGGADESRDQTVKQWIHERETVGEQLRSADNLHVAQVPDGQVRGDVSYLNSEIVLSPGSMNLRTSLQLGHPLADSMRARDVSTEECQIPRPDGSRLLTSNYGGISPRVPTGPISPQVAASSNPELTVSLEARMPGAERSVQRSMPRADSHVSDNVMQAMRKPADRVVPTGQPSSSIASPVVPRDSTVRTKLTSMVTVPKAIGSNTKLNRAGRPHSVLSIYTGLTVTDDTTTHTDIQANTIIRTTSSPGLSDLNDPENQPTEIETHTSSGSSTAAGRHKWRVTVTQNIQTSFLSRGFGQSGVGKTKPRFSQGKHTTAADVLAVASLADCGQPVAVASKSAIELQSTAKHGHVNPVLVRQGEPVRNPEAAGLDPTSDTARSISDAVAIPGQRDPQLIGLSFVNDPQGEPILAHANDLIRSNMVLALRDVSIHEADREPMQSAKSLIVSQEIAVTKDYELELDRTGQDFSTTLHETTTETMRDLPQSLADELRDHAQAGHRTAQVDPDPSRRERVEKSEWQPVQLAPGALGVGAPNGTNKPASRQPQTTSHTSIQVLVSTGLSNKSIRPESNVPATRTVAKPQFRQDDEPDRVSPNSLTVQLDASAVKETDGKSSYAHVSFIEETTTIAAVESTVFTLDRVDVSTVSGSTQVAYVTELVQGGETVQQAITRSANTAIAATEFQTRFPSDEEQGEQLAMPAQTELFDRFNLDRDVHPISAQETVIRQLQQPIGLLTSNDDPLIMRTDLETKLTDGLSPAFTVVREGGLVANDPLSTLVRGEENSKLGMTGNTLKLSQPAIFDPKKFGLLDIQINPASGSTGGQSESGPGHTRGGAIGPINVAVSLSYSDKKTKKLGTLFDVHVNADRVRTDRSGPLGPAAANPRPIKMSSNQGLSPAGGTSVAPDSMDESLTVTPKSDTLNISTTTRVDVTFDAARDGKTSTATPSQTTDTAPSVRRGKSIQTVVTVESLIEITRPHTCEPFRRNRSINTATIPGTVRAATLPRGRTERLPVGLGALPSGSSGVVPETARDPANPESTAREPNLHFTRSLEKRNEPKATGYFKQLRDATEPGQENRSNVEHGQLTRCSSTHSEGESFSVSEEWESLHSGSLCCPRNVSHENQSIHRFLRKRDPNRPGTVTQHTNSPHRSRAQSSVHLARQKTLILPTEALAAPRGSSAPCTGRHGSLTVHELNGMVCENAISQSRSNLVIGGDSYDLDQAGISTACPDLSVCEHGASTRESKQCSVHKCIESATEPQCVFSSALVQERIESDGDALFCISDWSFPWILALGDATAHECNQYMEPSRHEVQLELHHHRQQLLLLSVQSVDAGASVSESHRARKWSSLCSRQALLRRSIKTRTMTSVYFSTDDNMDQAQALTEWDYAERLANQLVTVQMPTNCVCQLRMANVIRENDLIARSQTADPTRHEVQQNIRMTELSAPAMDHGVYVKRRSVSSVRSVSPRLVHVSNSSVELLAQSLLLFNRRKFLLVSQQRTPESSIAQVCYSRLEGSFTRTVLGAAQPCEKSFGFLCNWQHTGLSVGLCISVRLPALSTCPFGFLAETVTLNSEPVHLCQRVVNTTCIVMTENTKTVTKHETIPSLSPFWTGVSSFKSVYRCPNQERSPDESSEFGLNTNMHQPNVKCLEPQASERISHSDLDSGPFPPKPDALFAMPSVHLNNTVYSSVTTGSKPNIGCYVAQVSQPEARSHTVLHVLHKRCASMENRSSPMLQYLPQLNDDEKNQVLCLTKTTDEECSDEISSLSSFASIDTRDLPSELANSIPESRIWQSGFSHGQYSPAVGWAAQSRAQAPSLTSKVGHVLSKSCPSQVYDPVERREIINKDNLKLAIPFNDQVICKRFTVDPSSQLKQPEGGVTCTETYTELCNQITLCLNDIPTHMFSETTRDRALWSEYTEQFESSYQCAIPLTYEAESTRCGDYRGHSDGQSVTRIHVTGTIDFDPIDRLQRGPIESHANQNRVARQLTSSEQVLLQVTEFPNPMFPAIREPNDIGHATFHNQPTVKPVFGQLALNVLSNGTTSDRVCLSTTAEMNGLDRTDQHREWLPDLYQSLSHGCMTGSTDLPSPVGSVWSITPDHRRYHLFAGHVSTRLPLAVNVVQQPRHMYSTWMPAGTSVQPSDDRIQTSAYMIRASEQYTACVAPHPIAYPSHSIGQTSRMARQFRNAMENLINLPEASLDRPLPTIRPLLKVHAFTQLVTSWSATRLTEAPLFKDLSLVLHTTWTTWTIDIPSMGSPLAQPMWLSTVHPLLSLSVQLVSVVELGWWQVAQICHASEDSYPMSDSNTVLRRCSCRSDAPCSCDPYHVTDFTELDQSSITRLETCSSSSSCSSCHVNRLGGLVGKNGLGLPPRNLTQSEHGPRHTVSIDWDNFDHVPMVDLRTDSARLRTADGDMTTNSVREQLPMKYFGPNQPAGNRTNQLSMKPGIYCRRPVIPMLRLTIPGIDGQNRVQTAKQPSRKTKIIPPRESDNRQCRLKGYVQNNRRRRWSAPPVRSLINVLISSRSATIEPREKYPVRSRMVFSLPTAGDTLDGSDRLKAAEKGVRLSDRLEFLKPRTFVAKVCHRIMANYKPTSASDRVKPATEEVRKNFHLLPSRIPVAQTRQHDPRLGPPPQTGHHSLARRPVVHKINRNAENQQKQPMVDNRHPACGHELSFKSRIPIRTTIPVKLSTHKPKLVVSTTKEVLYSTLRSRQTLQPTNSSDRHNDSLESRKPVTLQTGCVASARTNGRGPRASLGPHSDPSKTTVWRHQTDKIPVRYQRDQYTDTMVHEKSTWGLRAASGHRHTSRPVTTVATHDPNNTKQRSNAGTRTQSTFNLAQRKLYIDTKRGQS